MKHVALPNWVDKEIEKLRENYDQKYWSRNELCAHVKRLCELVYSHAKGVEQAEEMLKDFRWQSTDNQHEG